MRRVTARTTRAAPGAATKVARAAEDVRLGFEQAIRQPVLTHELRRRRNQRYVLPPRLARRRWRRERSWRRTFSRPRHADAGRTRTPADQTGGVANWFAAARSQSRAAPRNDKGGRQPAASGAG